ncbi:MAG: hypothetical protein IKX31_10030 [Muribaculaceae bacterium]|nr:hypothetical protein [Muribaculaceae bacterium]
MELNFNSLETIANLNASAAFQVDSRKMFKMEAVYLGALKYKNPPFTWRILC